MQKTASPNSDWHLVYVYEIKPQTYSRWINQAVYKTSGVIDATRMPFLRNSPGLLA